MDGQQLIRIWLNWIGDYLIFKSCRWNWDAFYTLMAICEWGWRQKWEEDKDDEDDKEEEKYEGDNNCLSFPLSIFPRKFAWLSW